MKLGRLWAVVAFLMIGVVICVATVGLFFLSGGTVSPEQETLPEAPQNQPEGPLRVVVIDAGHGGEDGGAVGVSGLVAAFGFSVFADILLVFGLSLALAAIGLLLLWIFIWMLAGAIPGLVRGLVGLARKLCYKEVSA